MKKLIAVISTTAIVGLGLAACSTGSGTTNSQKDQQKVTESYAQKLSNAEPYPLSQMNDSAERANLRERLLRLNDPNKIGYVYELSQTGSVIAEYTVKGKISSTASQLTNSQNINYDNGYSSNGGNTVTESMGDDGSYGPEEGGQNGIFFFTTSGVLVEWDGLWQYSDAPLNLTSAPLITMDAHAKPSNTAGQLK